MLERKKLKVRATSEGEVGRVCPQDSTSTNGVTSKQISVCFSCSHVQSMESVN